MAKRPSLRELVRVWLASASAGVVGWVLVDDAGFLTADVALGGGLFVLAPLFFVVYSVLWAWPLAATGDRLAVSGLFAFAVIVQAVSGWFWVGVETITFSTLVMRLLSVFSPLVFGLAAVSAAWTHRKHLRLRRFASVLAQDGLAPKSLVADREADSAAHDATAGPDVENPRRLSV